MNTTASWLKVAGWIVGGALLVGGWIYAGIMSQYTGRILRLETLTELHTVDIRAMQLQQVRFEEMFKSITAKLDLVIEQHKEER